MVATSMLLMKVSILHAIIVTQLAVYNAAFFYFCGDLAAS